MSFGVVQNAIVSIKSNRNLLSKRDRLKNTLSGSRLDRVDYNLPKATPSMLLKIKTRLQEENKQLKTIRFVVLTIIMFVIVFTILYFV